MNNLTNLILKEFQFLKNISTLKDSIVCSIEINDGFIVPYNIFFDKVLKKTKDYKDEFLVNNDEQSLLLLQFNDLNKLSGYLCLKLDKQKNNFFFNIIDITHNQLNVIESVIEWFKNLFLIEDTISLQNNTKTIIDTNIKNKVGDKMILTAGPSIGVREKIYSTEATLNGWNNQWNNYLTQFEKKFAEYIGVKYSIATSSCTGAMQLALMALDIGKGDEVIVPDVTWVSTANVVHAVGANPIFADVDIDTWTLDPKSVELKITKKTKAIMPVHMYGHPANMDAIINLAKKYNLKIIEDAAPSIGALYKGKKTGSFGDFSAFSFQGAKLLVTGEGGMLCTNDEKLYKKAYRLWDQGRIPGTFWIEEHGPKYKMSNIQAALGLGQLERIDLMIEKKRQINNWYKSRLNQVNQIVFWDESKDVKSICWMTSIRLTKKIKLNREQFCLKLKERNIDSRPVFPSISQYPYWRNKQDSQNNSNIIANTGINLPSGVCLSKAEVDYICDSIIDIINNDK